MVGDVSTGAVLADATVTLNGVRLTYDAVNQDYEGDVLVDPGAHVTLNVNVHGNQYTASAQQFATYPTISTPRGGSTWATQCTGSVAWSGGTPTSGATYGLLLLDAARPNDPPVWPGTGGPEQVGVETTSFTVPPGTWSMGSRLLVVGIFATLPVPGADPHSVFEIGGFNAVPLVINSTPTLDSLSLSAGNGSSTLALLKNSTELFDVSGRYCDGTEDIDLREIATWTTSDAGVAMVSNEAGAWGTVTAIGDGATTLTATIGSQSASLELTVHGTLQDAGTADMLDGVAWSGSQYVAVGNGGILTSPDGVSWMRQTSGVYPVDAFSGVVWSGTEFLALGVPGEVLTSPDGVDWTRLSVSGAPNGLVAAASSGTQVVAVGFRAIVTSPDGLNWTARSFAPAGSLYSIVWTGTQFVAGGDGIIFTSSDGATWTPRDTGTPDAVKGLAWSGTELVAVGQAGALLTSPDGVTWTQQTSPVVGGNYWSAVTWTGTEFVAVGDRSIILTSPDGVHWTTWLPALLYSSLNSVTRATPDDFIAVGINNITSRSAVVTSW